MSVKFSNNVTNVSASLVNGASNSIPATGLLMNGTGSALTNQTSNNASTTQVTNTGNQLNSSIYNNLSRGMKENIFIAAINQINQTTNKQTIMNGLLQNVNQSQLTTSLVQQQHITAPLTTNSVAINQSHIGANTANCQQFNNFPQSNQQLSSPLRLKSLNNSENNNSLINGTSSALFRAFNGINCKQQAANGHQLINNGATNNNANNILLNISNHNNHSNSHFNHYNQHNNNPNTTKNYYNGYQLNYHLQNANGAYTNNQPHQYYHHSNSLSSSPRSSTSSNSSTSSSLMNYNNNNNLNGNKYNQNGQTSPTSSLNSPIQFSSSPSNQHSSIKTINGQNGTPKVKNTNQVNGQHQSSTANLNGSPSSLSPQQQVVSNQGQQQQQQQQQQQSQNGNSSRYKTELCRPYEESGFCKYSDKCQYAHGLSELRSLQRHPKYKTELCRTFHTTGFCPYGPRCHFIHNNDGGNQVFSKKENNLLMDSFSSGSSTPSNTDANAVAAAVAVLNGTNQSTNKSTVETIEINTNTTAASSGISSMGSSNTSSISSQGLSSGETSPQQTIFPKVSNIFNNQIKQANKMSKSNSNSKLQELLLPNLKSTIEPVEKNQLLSSSSSTSSISFLETNSGNVSPLQQQLSSLSSKSDDVFYKYI